jgi:hypothetical protein
MICGILYQLLTILENVPTQLVSVIVGFHPKRTLQKQRVLNIEFKNLCIELLGSSLKRKNPQKISVCCLLQRTHGIL